MQNLKNLYLKTKRVKIRPWGPECTIRTESENSSTWMSEHGSEDRYIVNKNYFYYVSFFSEYDEGRFLSLMISIIGIKKVIFWKIRREKCIDSTMSISVYLSLKTKLMYVNIGQKVHKIFQGILENFLTFCMRWYKSVNR